MRQNSRSQKYFFVLFVFFLFLFFFLPDTECVSNFTKTLDFMCVRKYISIVYTTQSLVLWFGIVSRIA